jgi:DUF971 family protein
MIFTPSKIEPFSPTEMFIEWNQKERFSVPYVEIRYYCPCAGCVDEHTGERTIEHSSINPDIRPTNAQLVGRYAIQIDWSDGHSTGMYHYDRLRELCEKQGKKLH